MVFNMNNKYKYIYSSKGEKISGLLLIEPNIFYDERGFFLESWNKKNFQNILQKENQAIVELIQENYSKSSKGVLRGLHYQREPHAQGKLIRCISGSIFDVVLDLRKNSHTFSQWAGISLSSKNLNQLWIPKGFAHGFLSLSNATEVSYKTTDYWHKECEMTILWNDKKINIEWPLEKINFEVITSEKDKQAKEFSEINRESFF